MLADSLTRCIQHTIHTCPTNVQSNPTRGLPPLRSLSAHPEVYNGVRQF